MKHCYICKKIIWFWQKYDTDYGWESFDYGLWINYIHDKCHESYYNIKVKDLVT